MIRGPPRNRARRRWWRRREPLLLCIEGERLDTSIRVVVGEAAGLSPLRSTLQREGFDVVGYAASNAGLEAVLAGVRAEAIVLDAQIGVNSLVSARQLAPAAKVLVVWPSGVSAVMADERIDPARVATDLAPAVRRAVATSLEAEPVAYQYEYAVREPRLALTSNWERPRARARARTRGRAVALAIVSTLLLGAAAFAIAAPQWRHESSERRTTEPAHHRQHTSTSTTTGQHTPDSQDPGTNSPTGGCDSNRQGPPADKHPDSGRHLGSRGCPPGPPNEHGNNGHHQTPNGQHAPPGGAGHGHGQGSGQGQGQGHGQGDPQRPSGSEHPTHP